jgi:hypothetical protein
MAAEQRASPPGDDATDHDGMSDTGASFHYRDDPFETEGDDDAAAATAAAVSDLVRTAGKESLQLLRMSLEASLSATASTEGLDGAIEEDFVQSPASIDAVRAVGPRCGAGEIPAAADMGSHHHVVHLPSPGAELLRGAPQPEATFRQTLVAFDSQPRALPQSMPASDAVLGSSTGTLSSRRIVRPASAPRVPTPGPAAAQTGGANVALVLQAIAAENARARGLTPSGARRPSASLVGEAVLVASASTASPPVSSFGRADGDAGVSVGGATSRAKTSAGGRRPLNLFAKAPAPQQHLSAPCAGEQSADLTLPDAEAPAAALDVASFAVPVLQSPSSTSALAADRRGGEALMSEPQNAPRSPAGVLMERVAQLSPAQQQFLLRMLDRASAFSEDQHGAPDDVMGSVAVTPVHERAAATHPSANSALRSNLALAADHAERGGELVSDSRPRFEDASCASTAGMISSPIPRSFNSGARSEAHSPNSAPTARMGAGCVCELQARFSPHPFQRVSSIRLRLPAGS